MRLQVLFLDSPPGHTGLGLAMPHDGLPLHMFVLVLVLAIGMIHLLVR